jgi:hypothetical protein
MAALLKKPSSRDKLGKNLFQHSSLFLTPESS